MQQMTTPFKKLLLVCTNSRENGACCATRGSEQLRDAIKARVKELGLPVRVSKSGCLDMCNSGPTVAIMPDNLWFGGVILDDVEAIISLLQK